MDEPQHSAPAAPGNFRGCVSWPPYQALRGLLRRAREIVYGRLSFLLPTTTPPCLSARVCHRDHKVDIRVLRKKVRSPNTREWNRAPPGCNAAMRDPRPLAPGKMRC